jgi:hypothetical protein
MKPRRRRYYGYARADGTTGWEDKVIHEWLQQGAGRLLGYRYTGFTGETRLMTVAERKLAHWGAPELGVAKG